MRGVKGVGLMMSTCLKADQKKKKKGFLTSKRLFQ